MPPGSSTSASNSLLNIVSLDPSSYQTIAASPFIDNSVYMTCDSIDREFERFEERIFQKTSFETFIQYLKPVEIKNLWDKVSERIMDQDEKKKFLKSILETTKMSEKFIMDNISSIDIEWLKKNKIYSSLINSGEYKNLKLYIYS